MAKIRFYQCTKCETIYPPDYMENWGRKYGKGLGSSPCCEALTSNYASKPQGPIGQPHLAMHSVGNCRGMMIPVMLDEATPTAILADEDRLMTKRAKVMQDIQRKQSPELDAMLKAVGA